MTAYLIADIEVTDAAGYDEYKARVPAVIAAFGGRYLVRGGAVEVLEGAWRPRRTAVIEFPSLASLQSFWASADYAPLRALRERSARSNIVIVEGVPG
jgi:uncharacterized protein (DUF1330 family)